MFLSEDKLTVVEPSNFYETLYLRYYCENNNLQMSELIADTTKTVFVINSDVVCQLREDISGRVYNFMELIHND